MPTDPPRWQRDAGTDREADGRAAQHTGATGKAAGGAPMPVQELGAEKPAWFGREGLKKPKHSTRNTRRVHLVAFLKPRAARGEPSAQLTALQKITKK